MKPKNSQSEYMNFSVIFWSHSPYWSPKFFCLQTIDSFAFSIGNPYQHDKASQLVHCVWQYMNARGVKKNKLTQAHKIAHSDYIIASIFSAIILATEEKSRENEQEVRCMFWLLPLSLCGTISFWVCSIKMGNSVAQI